MPCGRDAANLMEERLQKIIARAGITSRRRAEEMISSGLITVNGHVVTELGTKAEGSGDATSTEVLAEMANLVAAGRIDVPIAATNP